MDSSSLMIFSKLVKDLWPQIGIQLVTALASYDDKIQKEKKDHVILETNVQFLYIDPSSVLTVFFQVCDSVVELLASCHVEVLLDVCDNLMASDKHFVKHFSDKQMKRLNDCDSSLLLLQQLSLFFTWSSHSILRVLADQCSEAVDILDNFDCRVNSLEPIASYPIPCFPLNMIPVDTSTHTILAIRCDQALYECTLQHVYDMQSVMIEKCDITQHCLQLLAVRSNPTIFYWTIPECVVYLININAPLYSEYLHSKGILELLVYPDLQLTFGDHVRVGLLVFSDDSKLVETKHKNSQEHHKLLQETLECLKADKIALEDQLDDLNAKLQTLNVNTANKQLYEKLTDIKLENNQLNQQIKQLNSEVIEKEKEDQLNIQKEQELLEKNEQLNSKVLELTEKKDQLNKENLKINSELQENSAKLNKLEKQNEQLKLELQVIKEKFSKVQNDEDSPNDQDDLTELEREVHAADHHQVSSLQLIPSQDEDQHQQVHHDHHPHVSSMMQQFSLDDDEEDLQQQCCQDYDSTMFMYGRPDTGAFEFSEVNFGKGETMEVINKEIVGNVPVQEESQVATVQEKSQAEASKSQERVSSLSVQPTVANIFTGDNRHKPLNMDFSDMEKSKKICEAVSEYYIHWFLKHWKTMTNQECGKIKVIAALLIEKRNRMKVVVLTAGTKHKTECSYFVKRDSSTDDDDLESSYGLCDGHAEAVCYDLASVYLMTEIYKLDDGENSIFQETDEGYVLKPNIHFHLFTSHPPCGFMAKEERHLLSWKRPFKGKPHNLQCSSHILISAYLGIQGSLSHLLVKPIYISSVTIPRYETVTALHGTYIQDRLQEFKSKHPDMSLSESDYRLIIPHIIVLEVDVLKLFPECFRPYIREKPCNLSTSDGQLPQQETTTVAKQQTAKGAKKSVFATEDVIGNSGLNAMVFSLEEGIGSEEFRKSVHRLKSNLVKVPVEIKQRRLKSLQDARIRLSHALNVSEALQVLKEIIIQEMDEKFTKRCIKADNIISLLKETREQKTDVEKLKMQMNDLKSVVKALTHNRDFQVMLNDLEGLLEAEKSHSGDPEFYLDLMGCNWVRYMKTILDDIK